MVRHRTRQNDKRNATIRMCGTRNANSNDQVRLFRLILFFQIFSFFIGTHMLLLLVRKQSGYNG